MSTTNQTVKTKQKQLKLNTINFDKLICRCDLSKQQTTKLLSIIFDSIDIAIKIVSQRLLKIQIQLKTKNNCINF